MSTLAVVRARIADDILRSDLNSQIDIAINRAIEYYYNKKRFWFNETSSTFSTIANQEAYGTADGTPTTLLEIDYVKITLSTNNQPDLTKKTFDYIQQRNSGRATGDPSEYAFYGDKFYFSLIPSAVRTITVFHTKSYTELSADSDTNDFTVNAKDLIEARARWWICMRIIGDDKAAAMAKNEEMEALTALEERTRLIKSSGQITPTSF